MRFGFGVVALAALAGVAWLSFSDHAAEAPRAPAALPSEAPETVLPAEVASAPTTQKLTPVSEIPYDKLTTYAKAENRVIYTTSSLGEPMEVHPDGLVVIYNHRTVIRYGDGREEVRYVTMRARPKLMDPAKAVTVDEEQPQPPK
jgi:hypothetical protein